MSVGTSSTASRRLLLPHKRAAEEEQAAAAAAATVHSTWAVTLGSLVGAPTATPPPHHFGGMDPEARR